MPKAYSYIRFSSKRQERGSSLERQTAVTVEFAKKHGLDLQDLTFSDLGVSAFRGRHAESGALRAFVEAVEGGKIEKGSWLLVESLDRISREKLGAASRRLSELLEMGITIATIADGRVYEPSSRDTLGDALQMMVVLSRAHDESLMKSERAKGSWEKIRRTARESGAIPRAKAAQAPWWLEVAETGELVEVPERVAIVRRIFDMALAGLGSTTIARQLNSDGIPTPTGRLWTSANVGRTLRQRYALGEWQPRKTVTVEGGQRKAKPEGEPVKIYPQIISEGDWLKVQRIRERRDNLTGRAASAELRNVFTGLAKCKCGAPMRFTGRPGRAPVLCCRSVDNGHDCEYRREFQYKPFEAMTLTALSRLDFSALFPEGRDKLRKKLEELEGALLEAEKSAESAQRRSARAARILLETEDENLAVTVGREASAAEVEHRRALGQAEELRVELGEIRETLANMAAPSMALQQLAEAMREEGGKERVNQILKAQLASMEVDAKAGRCELTLRHTGDVLALNFQIRAGGRRPTAGEWEVEQGGRVVSRGVFGSKDEIGGKS